MIALDVPTLEHELLLAQLRHTSEMTRSPHLSDDGCDYLVSACDLASLLTLRYSDGPGSLLSFFCNDLMSEAGADEWGAWPKLFSDYACDGICGPFYDIMRGWHPESD